MSDGLSSNTQAILLLTAPLLVGGRDASDERLTSREYKLLARRLRDLDRQPADLLQPDASGVLRECAHVVEKARLERLLGRGFLLSQALERWRSRAIWVVSRADAAYPRRLKARMKEDAPPVLFGCGDASLLDQGGLAVVGSRHVDDTLLAYARGIGRLVASSGKMVISGGARGTDQAAVGGALTAGGRATGVLADSLEKVAISSEFREPLLGCRLLLVSPYDPAAGFNVGNAMQRNKYIYALADAGLVVSSDVNKGGTWAGATEQIEQLRYVPVFVRSIGERREGLEALTKKGALPWPNPNDAAGLAEVLRAERPSEGPPTGQHQLAFVASRPVNSGESLPQTTGASPKGPTPSGARTVATPGEELFAKVQELVLVMLKSPATEVELSDSLQVSKAQIRLWLHRLIEEGSVELAGRPAKYQLTHAGTSDPSDIPQPPMPNIDR